MEVTNGLKPRILCNLSGCLCKHVIWQDGEWVQTLGVIECPRFWAKCSKLEASSPRDKEYLEAYLKIFPQILVGGEKQK
jgi:hypothetical protein